MTSVSWDDTEEGGRKSTTPRLRWKRRNHFNFVAGRSRLRALPAVIHLLPDDIDWFAKDPSLFEELKSLIRDRVIGVANDGEKDPEAPKSRKRARKEELCVQGERIQFTYRFRKTLPRYTVLSYAEDTVEARGSRGDRTGRASGSRGPGFRHFPLSQSTLMVWVYRFDKDDPYRSVPNEAALQFAPTSKRSPGQALDVEAIGRQSKAGAGGAAAGVQGPRDTGLLAWLWGGDKGDDGAFFLGGTRGGGVRQHFVGSAEWQGGTAAAQGRDEEEEDIQRAIALSLGAGSGGSGEGRGSRDRNAVVVVDCDDGGVEESKGGR